MLQASLLAAVAGLGVAARPRRRTRATRSAATGSRRAAEPGEAGAGRLRRHRGPPRRHRRGLRHRGAAARSSPPARTSRSSAWPRARRGKRGRARPRSLALHRQRRAWTVWTRYDRVPGDGKEQYLEQYDRLGAEVDRQARRDRQDPPRARHRRPEGHANAKHTRDNSRPAVLYNAMQHAREWLAGETCRRSLDYFVDGYGTDPPRSRGSSTRASCGSSA